MMIAQIAQKLFGPVFRGGEPLMASGQPEISGDDFTRLMIEGDDSVSEDILQGESTREAAVVADAGAAVAETSIPDIVALAAVLPATADAERTGILAGLSVYSPSLTSLPSALQPPMFLAGANSQSLESQGSGVRIGTATDAILFDGDLAHLPAQSALGDTIDVNTPTQTISPSATKQVSGGFAQNSVNAALDNGRQGSEFNDTDHSPLLPNRLIQSNAASAASAQFVAKENAKIITSQAPKMGGDQGDVDAAATLPLANLGPAQGTDKRDVQITAMLSTSGVVLAGAGAAGTGPHVMALMAALAPNAEDGGAKNWSLKGGDPSHHLQTWPAAPAFRSTVVPSQPQIPSAVRLGIDLAAVDFGIDAMAMGIDMAEMGLDMPIGQPTSFGLQMAALTPPAANMANVAAPPLSAQILPFVDLAQTGPVEITLSPAELGKLRFEIHHRGEHVQIFLSAERPETLDLFRRNSDQLLTDFRNAGFSGASLAFGGWGAGQNKGQSAETVAAGDTSLIAPPAAFAAPSAAVAPTAANLDPTRSLNLRL